MKHLLLDFDGVVFKNKSALDYQKTKSINLIQKHSPNLTKNHIKKIKEDWKPKYKHTTTLIKNLFNYNISVQEYFKEIYNSNEFIDLSTNFNEETHYNMKQFINLVKFAEYSDISWSIFTNSHIDWVLYFSHLYGFTDINQKNVIWNNTNEFYNFKPHEYSFLKIENMYPYIDKFLYVDDTEININTIKNNKRWRTFLFGKNNLRNDIMKIYELMI